MARIQETDENPSTAISFLRFMCDLNDVFLQDCGALWVQHPERVNHPFFHCMQVFDMPEWMTYVSTMKSALKTKDNLLDANLELVIPGIQQWHNANTQSINQLSIEADKLTDIATNICEDIQEHQRDQQRQLATTFMGQTRSVTRSIHHRWLVNMQHWYFHSNCEVLLFCHILQDPNHAAQSRPSHQQDVIFV